MEGLRPVEQKNSNFILEIKHKRDAVPRNVTTTLLIL